MVFIGPASASVFNVFDFSFSGASYDGMGISLPAVSGSGEFDTMSSSSPYTVTGISGVTDGSVITGLSPYAGADQLLWAPPNPGSTDFSGISYSTASGTDFNLYYWGSGQWGLKSSVDPIGYPQDGQPISLTVTAVTEDFRPSITGVPELGTWVMLLLGFAGVGFVGYCRTNRAVAAVAP